MATPSPTKEKLTERDQPATGFVPSADNLLAKNLSREIASGEAGKPPEKNVPRNPGTGTRQAGRSREDDTAYGVSAIEPVSMDSTETPLESRRTVPVSERKTLPVRTSSTPGQPEKTSSAQPVSEVTQRPGPMPARPDYKIDAGTADGTVAHPDRMMRTQTPIARLSGHTLRFPAGTELGHGKKIEIDGRTFEIKPEEAFHGLFWVKSIGVLALTLLAAIGIAYIVSGPTQTSIVGVVIDAQTGRILPDATVSMADGRVARTNQAGIYQFAGVAPEKYVLTASASGFESQNGYIEPATGETDQLSFALAPQLLAGIPEDSNSAATSDAGKATEERTNESASTSNRSLGSVELAVDFEGYLVFVDGELYGKNSTEVKRLPEGTHRILLQLDGFEDYSTNVEIKARATATLKIAKTDLTPRIDPVKRSRGLFADGKNYFDKQEWGAAIHLFDQALEIDPEFADAHQYRGWAYLKMQKPNDARTDFTRAADLYDQAKKYIDAAACAKYLIELDPKDPANWRRRADYYLALTDYNNAIADYENAVKLDKKSLDNRMALGEALFAAGRYDEAAKEFDRARRLADDPSTAYIRMILAYYSAGDLDDVAKKYRDFTQVATPELLERLQQDPEWLKVMQSVGPEERYKN